MSTAHVFISHVEEDESVARELAHGLEAAGYAAWYYERDSAAGASYLVQTREAIVTAAAVVLLVSVDSLSSHQVTKEVVRAHESHKPIVPLLLDVTDAEYKRRQPEWEEAIGAATSVAVPDAGVSAILPRVLRGLQALGVAPGVAQSTPVPPRPGGLGLPPKAIVVGVLAGLIVLGAVVNLARALNPAPNSDEFRLYVGFPAVRLANVFGNGVNGALAAAMLLGLRRRRTDSVRTVRKAALAMVAVSLIWLAWVFTGTTAGANWSYLTPQDQSRLIGSLMTAGAVGLVLPGGIYLLNRKPS
jgi:hypothetical protein